MYSTPAPELAPERTRTLNASRTSVRIAVLAFSFLATSLGARFFVIPPEILAPVWPAAGVLLFGLLSVPAWAILPACVAVFVASVGGNWFSGVPLFPSIAFSVANCVGGVVGSLALRKMLGAHIRFDELRNVVMLMVVGAGLANSVGALAGATVVAGFGYASFGDAWVIWFLSNAWGILTVAPLAAEWGEIKRFVRKALPGVWAESLVVAVCLIATVLLAFSSYKNAGSIRFVAPFILFPLLVWVALRFGTVGATLASVVLTGLVLLGTAHGLGRFALGYETLHIRFIELQVFMTTATICSLVAAAMMADRQRAMESLAESERQLREALHQRDAAIRAEREANAGLRDSEERLRLSFEAARMGAWDWDLESNTVAWFGQQEVLFGFKGARPDASADAIFARIHPEDRERVPNEIRAWIAEGRTEYVQEFRVVWDDGSLHWLFAKARIFYENGEPRRCLGINFDLTDRKRLEEQLRQRAEEVEKLMDVAPVAIWVAHDPQCKDITGNRMANQFYEARSGENVSASGPALQHRRFFREGVELTPEELPMQYSVTHGVDVQGELDVVMPSGKRITIWGRSSPLRDASGQVRGCIGTFVDVTDRKRTEQALLQTEKLATVGRMAATIAHEINNPLETITNAVFLAALDPALSADTRQTLDLASTELERVAHITRQALGFYRGNAAPAPVDTPELVNGVLDLFAPKLRSKNIAVEKLYGDRVPAIEAIAGEIRQIVSNFISNSIDAVDHGGKIAVRITPAPCTNGTRRVHLTFADNGSGIAPEHLKRIFEPFFTTKDTIGTGLGLWVVNEIVTRHGGRIRARSRVGKGTVFTVSLPVSSDISAELLEVGSRSM
ncbi:MAG TPA: MASE1 domain-containing protein [Terriglobales bacterium]|nr:MASE1 domain-containing protein [Terriglobales bacterium]